MTLRNQAGQLTGSNKSLEVWGFEKISPFMKKSALEKRKLGNQQSLIIDVHQNFFYLIS